MGRHQRRVRPRYGRLAAAGTSVAVTTLALLGGVGLLPSSTHFSVPYGAIPPAAAVPVPDNAGAAHERPARARRPVAEPPAHSGRGRRVVFSQRRQRVWLVGAHDRVRRTYLVSGSRTDNLDPGTYEVYSRSMNAIGIDDSGTMRYFVRFARGDSGAAIGFHDIPIAGGERVQGVDQLGTPTSHGCIRQRRVDAQAMWAFAHLGTTVVVVG